MNGIKTTLKDLRALAHELAVQGLCNEQPLGSKEWFERRDRQGYTRVAYSQGTYGIMAEIYYLKGEKTFCYV